VTLFLSLSRVKMSDHEGHHRRSLHELLRSLRKAHWMRTSGDDHSQRRSSLEGGCGGGTGGDDFRSRSRSLDDSPRGSVAAALARGRAALARSRVHRQEETLGEVEATYRVYDSIVREGNKKKASY